MLPWDPRCPRRGPGPHLPAHSGPAGASTAEDPTVTRAPPPNPTPCLPFLAKPLLEEGSPPLHAHPRSPFSPCGLTSLIQGPPAAFLRTRRAPHHPHRRPPAPTSLPLHLRCPLTGSGRRRQPSPGERVLHTPRHPPICCSLFPLPPQPLCPCPLGWLLPSPPLSNLLCLCVSHE